MAGTCVLAKTDMRGRTHLEEVVPVVGGAGAGLSVLDDARRKARGAVQAEEVLLGEVVVRVVRVHQHVGPPRVRCRFGSTPFTVRRKVHVRLRHGGHRSE